MFTDNLDYNGNVMLQSNGSDRKLNGGDHMSSFASSNGVDYPKEFSNVAHPMEPVDLDQPIRCPPPEPCIMHVCMRPSTFSNLFSTHLNLQLRNLVTPGWSFQTLQACLLGCCDDETAPQDFNRMCSYTLNSMPQKLLLTSPCFCDPSKFLIFSCCYIEQSGSNSQLGW